MYTFEDAKNGGKEKAPTAAMRLKSIFPELNTKGIHIEIPMPGHFVEARHTKENLSKTIGILEKEAENADVIFLLTDSRESRWFYTVLG